MTHMCKQGCLFPGMAEWIDLPGHSGSATVSKVLSQKLQPQRMLIDDCIVMCCCFIVHGPASQNELQATCLNQKNCMKISITAKFKLKLKAAFF